MMLVRGGTAMMCNFGPIVELLGLARLLFAEGQRSF
jgi:hypothetical protein